MLIIELNSNWLFEQNKTSGDKSAIVSEGTELTYAGLFNEAENRSKQLSSTITEKDIVAISAEHSPKFIIDLFALWNLGAAVLPVNPKLKKAEIDRQLSFIGCKFISDYSTGEIKSRSLNNYNHDKGALLLFTSGSTGEQKAVQHTFKSLYSSSSSIDKVISFQKEDKWLASLPFYRIGGFQIILRSILSGGTLFIPQSVQTDAVLKNIQLYKPQYISLVNASLQKLLESNLNNAESSKAIFVGGGPVNADLMKEGINQGLPLYKVYGSTETGSMVSILSLKDALNKIESAGKPLPGIEIKVVDNEICVSSDSLFTGYYKNDDLTETRLKDGLYYTGDLGYFDEDGFLYIKKRKDNFIISGGEKIDPKEVENELNRFEGVEQAFVFGIPDDKWGEKVCAVLVIKNPINTNELQEKLKQSLPSYKIPKEFKQISKTPYDEMGKISLNKLKKLFS